MQHLLKILPEYFDPVRTGDKTVEIRREDDKTFAVGDSLVLREWNPDAGYTGRTCRVQVTHVLRDPPYVPPGYAALSIRLTDR